MIADRHAAIMGLANHVFERMSNDDILLTRTNSSQVISMS